MSIEKFNPNFIHEPVPFTMVNNNVIQNIDNPLALAVWVYLQSKPKDWLVMKSHVKTHFKISDKKLKDVFSYLAAHNLIKYIQYRLPNGRMAHTDIVILNGSEFSKIPLKNNTPTTGSKTTPAVIHPVEKKVLQRKSITNKENIKKRESATSLSDDFLPNDKNLEYMLSKGLDPQAVLYKFIFYAKENGWKRANWDDAFTKWIIDEKMPQQKAPSKVQSIPSQGAQSRDSGEVVGEAINRHKAKISPLLQEYLSNNPHLEIKGKGD